MVQRKSFADYTLAMPNVAFIWRWSQSARTFLIDRKLFNTKAVNGDTEITQSLTYCNSPTVCAKGVKLIWVQKLHSTHLISSGPSQYHHSKITYGQLVICIICYLEKIPQTT